LSSPQAPSPRVMASAAAVAALMRSRRSMSHRYPPCPSGNRV
jgi:hypothetical protein